MTFHKLLLVAATAGVALLGAAGARAQEATPAPEIDAFKAGKSRAEVRAETVAAAQAGLIARNDADMQRLATAGFQASKPRANVQAETLAAARLGLTRYGEAGAPEATRAQLEAITLAGERAPTSTSLVAGR